MSSIKAGLRGAARSADQLLRRVPALRQGLVYAYHYARRIGVGLVRRARGYRHGFLTPAQRLTPAGKHCFFGYYDKCPFSSDGQSYLFLMIPGARMPRVGEKAQVCLARSAADYRVIGETLAWNLQQGAMLRFLRDDLIAWNDYDPARDMYVTRLWHGEDGSTTTLDHPLYDVSDDTRWGLSIDFERLNVDAAGYGYIQQQRTQHEEDTAIRLVDMDTGDAKTILTLKDMRARWPYDGFAYFNHLEFNPSGERFIFILRYVRDGRRYSRLYASDRDGGNVHLLANEEMVSHCTWQDDCHVTLWCRLGGRNAYYVITDAAGAPYRLLGSGAPGEDGHPSYSRDGKKIITDTYPDKAEYRHLLLYNCAGDRVKDLARLYAPVLLHGPRRCDFHPRWHPDMKHVVIDSVHDGVRGMYLVNTEE